MQPPSDKVRDFVAKIQLIEFLAIFLCDFFICHITCARVATHAIFTARWRCDNFFKKSHHHRKQKIARVAAALKFFNEHETIYSYMDDFQFFVRILLGEGGTQIQMQILHLFTKT